MAKHTVNQKLSGCDEPPKAVSRVTAIKSRLCRIATIVVSSVMLFANPMTFSQSPQVIDLKWNT
ncbi:MAG TPA: hypothetical protein VHL14_15735 [Steroidobacteraceae bacterium]|nr:hypothetical protein [Steroidobacteraceae bacterium]